MERKKNRAHKQALRHKPGRNTDVHQQSLRYEQQDSKHHAHKKSHGRTPCELLTAEPAGRSNPDETINTSSTFEKSTAGSTSIV
jgi:hypothetical protein